LDLYNSGRIDAIYIVYTRFVSMLSQIATSAPLLPLKAAFGAYGGESPPGAAGGGGGDGDGGSGGSDGSSGSENNRGGNSSVGSGDSGSRSGGSGGVSSDDDGASDGGGAPHGAAAVKPIVRYEPECAEFVEQSTPFFIASTLFGAILESSVSEQCSRIISMDTAMKNSDEMIEALTLQYNKARQASITSELADILGGTKALKMKAEAREG
jgi:F0F1-type ATP synthase gamma subunit